MPEAAAADTSATVAWNVSAPPNPSVGPVQPVQGVSPNHAAGTVNEQRGASSSSERSLARVAAQWLGASSR
jgi:hypothetical protein